MTKKTPKTPSSEVEVINALSLLAHKVAPNVFDLSSLQWHVSIRDQIVRAQLLMADLCMADKDIDSVLIIGMGAAGISAAMAACEQGIPNVCVVDRADAPFKLFSGVTSRFVGPFMYEWPSSFHSDQSYPEHASTPWGDQGRSYLNWSVKAPISADDLAKELTNSFTTWLAKRNADGLSLPYMLVNVTPKIVRLFAKRFARAQAQRAKETLKGGIATTPKAQFSRKSNANALVWGSKLGAGFPSLHRPDYLILAAGMGQEKLTIPDSTLATPSFWANDTLKDPNIPDQRVIVLGGGDGALQDALRALTNYDHPLSLVQDLQHDPFAGPVLSAELPALLDADRQMRQHSTWAASSKGQAMVDKACRMAADKLAADPAVRRCILRNVRLGTGSIGLWVAGPHFDKAYLLNRFVIYLLWACCRKIARRPAGRVGFEVQFSTKVDLVIPPLLRPRAGAPLPARTRRWTLHVSRLGDVTFKHADKVVIRFGIQRDTIPGLQMVQLGVPNERDLKQRATLKGIELPFVAM